MMTQLMTVLTAVICLLSHTCMAQRWRGGWMTGRRYGNLHTPYNIPIAEPEPEPEPFYRRLSSRLIPRQNRYTPYTIPFAEPEPEPFTGRLSRRLIDREKQNLIQKLMIPTTPPPVMTTTERSSTVTTLQTTLPDWKTTILKLLEESFPTSAAAKDLQFDQIFSESSAPNPWAIDTGKFEIVPAVPSQYTPDIERVAKEVSEDNRGETDLVKPNYVPKQFSPVPAVPVVTTAPDDKLVRQQKNTMELRDDNLYEEKVAIETVIKNEICLEKCVQQFCIPEEDLIVISNCVDKCKIFCL